MQPSSIPGILRVLADRLESESIASTQDISTVTITDTPDGVQCTFTNAVSTVSIPMQEPYPKPSVFPSQWNPERLYSLLHRHLGETTARMYLELSQDQSTLSIRNGCIIADGTGVFTKFYNDNPMSREIYAINKVHYTDFSIPDYKAVLKGLMELFKPCKVKPYDKT